MCLKPGKLIQAGVAVGLLFSVAGFLISKFLSLGHTGGIPEFIMAAVAAGPYTVAERFFTSEFLCWVFIFCFWALTGGAIGWFFASKSRSHRVCAVFLLTGVVLVYSWGVMEFRKQFKQSMSYAAGYLAR